MFFFICCYSIAGDLPSCQPKEFLGADGSTTRDPSSVLNRYSYTPGLTDQRRHWYDDHNIY
ncbi:hypothetical protein TELCIR_03522 [Teladorsagia circumcincta]|uniref:Uncharacterized protein n=1 Tax=Teladorsagia circumcincta TaxID=45464 RepID=A0A2G9UXN0_TELCI|nr:hypothetical protein TELCIR_03522 [Teladorsagia circumcincta]